MPFFMIAKKNVKKKKKHKKKMNKVATSASVMVRVDMWLQYWLNVGFLKEFPAVNVKSCCILLNFKVLFLDLLFSYKVVHLY